MYIIVIENLGEVRCQKGYKMVTVHFELEDKDIISTSKYFNNSYTEAWLDDWAKRVIREIDKYVAERHESCSNTAFSGT